MRTVSYKSVIDRVSGYLGENGGMSAEDAGLANRLFNSRYRVAFEFFFWPDVLDTERRQFRVSWDSVTSFSAPTATAAVEVYYVPALTYYQALQPSLNQPPASGSDNTENSAYWAVAQPFYSGADWATGAVLAVGTIVRNPADDRFYQTITAHTAGGSFDQTKFGILTPFVRSLDYEQAGQTPFGEIKKIWDRDPDASSNAREIAFTLRAGFVLVRGTVPRVWVEFRVRPNSFTGVNWAPTGWNVGDQVYYDVTGEYYTCIAPAAGEFPDDPTKWRKLDVPYFLGEYLAQSVYGAMVAKEEALPEDFTVEQTAGWPLLVLELQKIERQQGQTRQLRVLTRR